MTIQDWGAVGEIVGAWDTAHAEHEAGVISDETLEQVRRTTMFVVAPPGGRTWWDLFGSGFREGFRTQVQRHLAEDAARPRSAAEAPRR